jgi:hypothetical protein
MRTIEVEDFDRSKAGDGRNHRKTSRPTQAGSFRRSGSGDRISVESLAAVLVRKGLCTEAELLEEENLRSAESGRLQNAQYVRIENEEVDAEHWGRPQHPLRRVFAKYRWSRRLGTAIFGWKWKKLKKDHSPERVH